jgi:ribosome-associated toxin RatA of RatAB toxin-antitoxin module
MSQVSNSIEMRASPNQVFNLVSDLASWPKYLPHYRWIKVLENHSDYMLVHMACYRGLIPLNWISKYRMDLKEFKLYFYHQKAWTRGMKVVWDLEPLEKGKSTRDTITHEMEPVAHRFGNWMAHRLIGDFFIHYVATRTLKNFALHFSKKAQEA